MYSYHIKPTRSAAPLLLGYLAVSTTLPFLLSYKDYVDNTNLHTKGTINARSLFNKI